MPKGLQVSRMPPRKETESSGVEIAWKERRKKFVTRRSLSVMAYAFASILILVLVVRLFMSTIPLWLNVSLLVTAVFMVYGWTVLRSQRRAVETEEKIRHHEEYFEEIENEHAKLKAQTVKKKAKLVPDIPAAKPAAASAASADTTSLKKRKKKKSDLDGVEAEIADGLEDFCAHPSLKKHIQARVDEIESKARRKVEKEEERLAEERREVERLEAEAKDAERIKEENRKEEERRRIKKQKDERRELRNKSSIDVATKDIKPEDIEVVKKELEYYTRANAAVVAARETRIPAEVQKPEKKPRKMWQPKTEDPHLDAAASSSDIFLPTKISWHSESSGDRWGEETIERREKEWKSAGRNMARNAEWTRA